MATQLQMEKISELHNRVIAIDSFVNDIINHNTRMMIGSEINLLLRNEIPRFNELLGNLELVYQSAAETITYILIMDINNQSDIDGLVTNMEVFGSLRLDTAPDFDLVNTVKKINDINCRNSAKDKTSEEMNRINQLERTYNESIIVGFNDIINDVNNIKNVLGAFGIKEETKAGAFAQLKTQLHCGLELFLWVIEGFVADLSVVYNFE
jgi:hypothetical protein